MNILILGLGNIGAKYVKNRHNIGFMCVDNIAKKLQKNFSEDKKLLCYKLESKLGDFLESLGENVNILSQLKYFRSKDSKQDSKDCIESTKDSKDFIESKGKSKQDSKDFTESTKDSKYLQEKFASILQKMQNLDSKIILIKPTTLMNNSGLCVAQVAKFYDISRMIVIYDDLDTPFCSVNVRDSGSSGGHNGLKSINAHFGENYLRFKLGIGANRFCNEKIKSLYLSQFRNDLQSDAEFSLMCESFKSSLLSRYHFDSDFKTKSFEKILKERLFIESNLQKFPHLQSFFNDFISKTFHKTLNENVANYVLGDFSFMESSFLESILSYSISCIQVIFFDYFYKKSIESANFTPLDIFNVRFKS